MSEDHTGQCIDCACSSPTCSSVLIDGSKELRCNGCYSEHMKTRYGVRVV